jgi:hypothetical protein
VCARGTATFLFESSKGISVARASGKLMPEETSEVKERFLLEKQTASFIDKLIEMMMPTEAMC